MTRNAASPSALTTARLERLRADIADTAETTAVMERASATIDRLSDKLRTSLRLADELGKAATTGARAHADLLRLLDELDESGNAQTTDGALLVAELRSRWVGR